MISYIWKLTPRKQKEYILSFMPQFQQQLFKKLVSNKLRYANVYDAKKCIFVHIPKTAGLSVCSGLLNINAVGHMPLGYYYRVLGDEKFNQYYKFTFVRNPWDRVFSAYNYLRKGGISKDDLKWKPVFDQFNDFNDFVERWLDEENMFLILHFMPQIYFLKSASGLIAFDFIGRFETLEEDYEKLRLRFNGDPLKKVNITQKTQTYQDAYNQASIDKVAKLYQKDIEILGYDFESTEYR